MERKQLNREYLQKTLESRIQADLDADVLSGAALTVTQDGQTLWEGCFGTACPDSLFRLASMTKPITAAAVLLLEDWGELSVQDPVEKFLPAFAGRGMKLLHLLSHTSGLSQEDYVNRITPACRSSLPALVAYVATVDQAAPPGIRAEYSPVAAFALLTAIVEQVSGMDLQGFLQAHIFAPCHMTDTTFTPTPAQWKRLVPMHDRGRSGAVTPGCVFETYPATTYLGGAGLVGSLADYRNFAQMLLEEGSFRGRQVLPPQAVEKMATPQEKVRTGPVRWGLGVRVITGADYGSLPVGAFGWSGTYGTHFWVDPTNRITAVYLKNSRYDGGAGAVTARNFETDVYTAL